jgi:hypothetical protein
MSITTISSWFKHSQIEYFTPFMKLWLAFNSWYKLFFPNLRTDRAVIDVIKTNSSIKDNFNRLVDSPSDECKELRDALAILVNELSMEKLITESGSLVGFNLSDINPRFKTLQGRSRTNWLNLNTGNYILLGETTVVTSDKSVLFRELFEIIYQIRCSLIHGDFEVDDRRSSRLVKSSFVILNSIFGPIVSGSI